MGKWEWSDGYGARCNLTRIHESSNMFFCAHALSVHINIHNTQVGIFASQTSHWDFASMFNVHGNVHGFEWIQEKQFAHENWLIFKSSAIHKCSVLFFFFSRSMISNLNDYKMVLVSFTIGSWGIWIYHRLVNVCAVYVRELMLNCHTTILWIAVWSGPKRNHIWLHYISHLEML